MKLLKQLQVFLLYARSDQGIVHQLYERLTKDGVRVWMDVECILPGQDWEHGIRKAILTSDLVIVCLSEQFNREGGYRHEELKLALERAKTLPADVTLIIPARLDDCDLPEILSRRQYVNLFEADGYKKLMNALRNYLQSK